MLNKISYIIILSCSTNQFKQFNQVIKYWSSNGKYKTFRCFFLVQLEIQRRLCSECEEVGCGPLPNCTNSPGSFECSCQLGFRLQVVDGLDTCVGRGRFILKGPSHSMTK